MGFFYARERAKFERGFATTRQICEEAGMSAEAIEELYAFEYDQFKSDRRFYMHVLPLDGTLDEDEPTEEGRLFLTREFLEKLSANQPSISDWGRFDWLEDIDTPEIAAWLGGLSSEDIDLLTRLTVDDATQTEIARDWGVSCAAVSKRLARIRARYLRLMSID